LATQTSYLSVRPWSGCGISARPENARYIGPESRRGKLNGRKTKNAQAGLQDDYATLARYRLKPIPGEALISWHIQAA
jgi:hypothetical protein